MLFGLEKQAVSNICSSQLAPVFIRIFKHIFYILPAKRSVVSSTDLIYFTPTWPSTVPIPVAVLLYFISMQIKFPGFTGQPGDLTFHTKLKSIHAHPTRAPQSAPRNAGKESEQLRVPRGHIRTGHPQISLLHVHPKQKQAAEYLHVLWVKTSKT